MNQKVSFDRAYFDIPLGVLLSALLSAAINILPTANPPEILGGKFWLTLIANVILMSVVLEALKRYLGVALVGALLYVFYLVGTMFATLYSPLLPYVAFMSRTGHLVIAVVAALMLLGVRLRGPLPPVTFDPE